ncbi:MAG: hypothetical protein CVU44_21495 [Chloroflexi bacterium HGW-Chloroflexi-6]|nr:MAG: hypothetical protein CVU44_21495 [Chloroflexi bacterium HGW-Chloroflexi-6]
MSGLGHLAAGFAAKPAAPQIPLWVYLVASETNDLLYFVFTAVGLEKPVATTMNFTEGIRYLEPVLNPWSHGLFMSAVWAGLAGALAWLIYRDRRAGLILGLVVFSHWIFDFLMHSNLPLFFAGSPQVGLGLENTGLGFLAITIFDLVVLAAGITVYFRTRNRNVFQHS